jgi:hypothetical protein
VTHADARDVGDGVGRPWWELTQHEAVIAGAHRATLAGKPTRLRAMDRIDTAVVGAGPFGLSVAAHASRHGSARTFGEPMRTWRRLMPPDMLLRSDWEHESPAPGGAGTSRPDCEAAKVSTSSRCRCRFTAADWFRRSFVPSDEGTSAGSSLTAACG